MAWFKRKENGGEGEGGDGPASGLVIEPDKAHAWFRQARTAADTRNYPYAIQCYLTGIKFDPTSLEAHKNLFEIANLYRSSGGKPATGKEIRDMLGDKKPSDRLAASEYAWVTDAFDVAKNLRFMKEAAELKLPELAYWAGELGTNALVKSRKLNKNTLVQYVDLFEQIGAFDMAVKIGDIAQAQDRTDANLTARIRNLSAQATMDRGKYDANIGQEGSFRGSIRDLEGQKQLIENETMAASEEVKVKRLDRYRDDWKANPMDAVAVTRYGEELAKSGLDANEQEAVRVFQQAYKDLKEYRFRAQAGDIHLARGRRKLRALKEKAETSGDAADIARAETAEKQLLSLEVDEYRERTEHYPTDLGLKYLLGERMFQAGLFDEAIAALQEAQSDSRNRAKAQHFIGLCFLKQQWFDEAVESLRSAVESYEIKDDETHLGMRYDLMEALESYARDNDDLNAAEEAGEHAKQIALKQLNFRDVKGKRESIRQLIKDLKTGKSA